MLRIVKNYIVAEEKVAKVARVLLATFSSRNNFCLKGIKQFILLIAIIYSQGQSKIKIVEIIF